MHTKEILDLPRGEAKPFELEKEFEALKPGLENLIETWAEWPYPPEEFWKSVENLQLFFPEQEDVGIFLDYSKVHQALIEKGREKGWAASLVFQLMQLFPEKRKELLQRLGIHSDQLPTKVFSGELLLVNELLVLAAAQPEHLPQYHARAAQELESVKKWILESLKFQNQERNVLELAANFLILCPEYKAEMQELLQPRLHKIVDSLPVSEYPIWLEMLGKLEIIYGSDKFHFDQRGNVVKEPKKPQLKTPNPLPERLTA